MIGALAAFVFLVGVFYYIAAWVRGDVVRIHPRPTAPRYAPGQLVRVKTIADDGMELSHPGEIGVVLDPTEIKQLAKDSPDYYKVWFGAETHNWRGYLADWLEDV